MTTLDPDFRSLISRSSRQRAATRKAQPRKAIESIAIVVKFAVQHQKFHATIKGPLYLDSRLPFFDLNRFLRILKEGSDRYPGTGLIGDPPHFIDVGDKGRAIIGFELPKLDKNDATGRRTRRMSGAGRVAHIRPARKVAPLVLKDPL